MATLVNTTNFLYSAAKQNYALGGTDCREEFFQLFRQSPATHKRTGYTWK